MKKAFILCLLLTGCTHVGLYHGFQPGTINRVDAETYTKILNAQNAASEGIAQQAAGSLPELLKTPLDNLIKASDTAAAAYKVWHNFNVGNPGAKLSPTLRLDMDQLDLAMYGFTGRR